jgi:hypothetical protein
MSDARGVRNFGIERFTCTQTVSAYELVQTPSGKAGFYDSAVAANSGDTIEVQTSGTAVITKASTFVALKGGRAYWDKSASSINYKKVNDRDFYAGRFAEDYLVAGATSCAILLNEDPPYDIDIARDTFRTVIVGTQALGGLALLRRGGAHNIILSATSEAQKIDLLSNDGFARTANAIVEAIFNVVSDGAGTTPDINIGIANGTHASDADSIGEYLFAHLDGNNVNINVQSKDGTTTVASTDTTIDYTEGSGIANRVEVWFDMRDEADVQVYVNAANVLPASVFKLDNASGPLRLVCHVEKTTGTDTYELDLESLRARFAEQ